MEILHYCPVCRHNKFDPFLSCKDFTVSRETFQIVACGKCGFRLTNPRPEENEIGKYYQSEEYISHSGTKKGIINKAYHLVKQYTLAKKLQLIMRISGSRKPGSVSILDYGCATGGFLNICKRAGYITTGVEPDEKARNFAKRQYRLEVIPPTEIISLITNSFDVITLWHVLEHIHRLQEFMIELGRITKKNGTAIIAVPNITSFDAGYYKEYWAAYDVPRHLYHFSPTDISHLFSEHGFDLEDVRPMIFDAFYVSILSEKYKSIENGKKNNTGKLFLAVLKGLKSNFSAINSKNTCSSQVYIFRKRN